MKTSPADRSATCATQERFRALWERCCRPRGAHRNGAEVYHDLVGRYREPCRRYHTWRHIDHCLNEFDRAAARIEHPDAVELALWFHDAVFVPGARDNEQRSAGLWIGWSRTSFAPALIDKVSDLILVTTHQRPPGNGDESFMVDIDLSSLGRGWPDFIRDSRNIREEQIDVPDALYYPAHVKFLGGLFDRPRIFYTDFFRDRYEQSARRNIERLFATDPYRENALDLNPSHRSA